MVWPRTQAKARTVKRELSCVVALGASLVLASRHAAAQPASGRVNFDRDIQPILRMHCASCHHPDSEWWPPDRLAGGLDLTTYDTVMKGGRSGRAIVPGNPAASLLIRRITESSDVRMPFLSPPLSDGQIARLRTWIAEGAAYEEAATPSYALEVDGVTKPPNSSLSIACRLLDEGFLDVEVIDPRTERALIRQFATAKWTGRGYADKSPGEWIRWAVRWETEWPAAVTVRLKMTEVPRAPVGAMFIAGGDGVMSRQLDFIPNPLNRSKDRTGSFRFFLQDSSNLAVEIKRERRTIFSDRVVDLPPGLRYYRWQLVTQQGQAVAPGDYAALFRFQPFSGEPPFQVAVFFQISP